MTAWTAPATNALSLHGLNGILAALRDPASREAAMAFVKDDADFGTLFWLARQFGWQHGAELSAHVAGRSQLRQFIGGQYAAETCCDLHTRTCEPGDLCCHDCPEGAHDTFPTRHGDGSRCVVDPS